MQDPYRVAADTFVVPSILPVPGMGLLYLNPMVIRAREPVLVDTGAPVFREEYLRGVFSLVDPADVRWIFLSHDDRDHAGNLMVLLEHCPNARVITDAIGAARLGGEWKLPMQRVRFIHDGEQFSVGDRTLAAIRPPLFDSPATRGLWDAKTRVYFSADAFGACVPHASRDVGDIHAAAFANGFDWFNRVNHPWHEYVNPKKFHAQVERIRRLDSRVIVSYHAPAARGRSEELCDMLEQIGRMQRLAAQRELEAMLLAS